MKKLNFLVVAVMGLFLQGCGSNTSSKYGDATYLVNMKPADVKVRLEKTLRTVYPNGKFFDGEKLNASPYNVFVTTKDSKGFIYTYYRFTELPSGKTMIHMYNAIGFGEPRSDAPPIVRTREESQEVLNTIVRKLGF